MGQGHWREAWGEWETQPSFPNQQRRKGRAEGRGSFSVTAPWTTQTTGPFTFLMHVWRRVCSQGQGRVCVLLCVHAHVCVCMCVC